MVAVRDRKYHVREAATVAAVVAVPAAELVMHTHAQCDVVPKTEEDVGRHRVGGAVAISPVPEAIRCQGMAIVAGDRNQNQITRTIRPE